MTLRVDMLRVAQAPIDRQRGSFLVTEVVRRKEEVLESGRRATDGNRRSVDSADEDFARLGEFLNGLLVSRLLYEHPM